MTIKDIEEYEKNAVEILRKHDQYATARAVERAFDALGCIQQFKWERDIALEQLEELGLSLGQKVDDVKIKHGYWTLLKNCSNAGVYCSVCHKKVYRVNYANVKVESKYCPNCGARMDGEFKEV